MGEEDASLIAARQRSFQSNPVLLHIKGWPLDVQAFTLISSAPGPATLSAPSQHHNGCCDCLAALKLRLLRHCIR